MGSEIDNSKSEQKVATGAPEAFEAEKEQEKEPDLDQRLVSAALDQMKQDSNESGKGGGGKGGGGKGGGSSEHFKTSHEDRNGSVQIGDDGSISFGKEKDIDGTGRSGKGSGKGDRESGRAPADRPNENLRCVTEIGPDGKPIKPNEQTVCVHKVNPDGTPETPNEQLRCTSTVENEKTKDFLKKFGEKQDGNEKEDGNEKKIEKDQSRITPDAPDAPTEGRIPGSPGQMQGKGRGPKAQFEGKNLDVKPNVQEKDPSPEEKARVEKIYEDLKKALKWDRKD